MDGRMDQEGEVSVQPVITSIFMCIVGLQLASHLHTNTNCQTHLNTMRHELMNEPGIDWTGQMHYNGVR